MESGNQQLRLHIIFINKIKQSILYWYRLQLQIKSLETSNEEYKMEISDIKKDRHYRTSKLSTQLAKFKELHNDAMEESEELMDEDY